MTTEIPSAATGTLDDLAETQAELRDLRRLADELLRGSWSVERYRSLLDGPGPAADPALWARLVEAGWPDLMVEDGAGGGGAGLRHLCVLTEAAGAVAAPVPLAAAAAAAWCRGRTVDDLTLLLPGEAELSVPETVSGTWPLVPHGAAADRAVVLARRDERAVLGLVDLTGPGVERHPLVPLDRGPAARIRLVRAPIEVLADGTAALRRHREAELRRRVAGIAELVGTAAAAHGAAVEYARARVAFGRPIGAFQAVKHRLVDQRSVIEVARALVNRGAEAVDRQDDDREALAALASFWAVDRLRAVPEGAGQVFGGIAYTWEHEAHAHLRRAACLVAGLGDRAAHRGDVIAWLAVRHAPSS